MAPFHLLKACDPDGDPDRIHLRAVVESLRPEANDELEAAIGRAVRLDTESAREAQQIRLESLQVDAEDIAHGRLERPRDPWPDRPLVPDRSDGGAPAHQAPRKEPRHGSGEGPRRR